MALVCSEVFTDANSLVWNGFSGAIFGVPRMEAAREMRKDVSMSTVTSFGKPVRRASLMAHTQLLLWCDLNDCVGIAYGKFAGAEPRVGTAPVVDECCRTSCHLFRAVVFNRYNDWLTADALPRRSRRASCRDSRERLLLVFFQTKATTGVFTSICMQGSDRFV